jgi:pimeloyl-ACP methyl ester carboxylesterase
MIGHTLHGHGPVRVIVLHGWLGDWSAFQPMLPALDPERFTFAFVDYRGYGTSKTIEGDYTLAEIAADARALADALGWSRFHVLGHSMGGAAALRLALDAGPDRVGRIIAVTPVPASGVPFERDALALFESAASGSVDARAAIIDFTTGGRLPKVWSRSLAERTAELCDPRAFAAYFQAWSRADFAAEAAGLALPIRVLVGEHDAAVTEPFIRTTYLATFQGADLVVLPNAGHYPMQEIPLALAAHIEAFL